MDTCERLGQRALVGKVCMDQHSPDDYCHDTERNLRDTEELIRSGRPPPHARRPPPARAGSDFADGPTLSV